MFASAIKARQAVVTRQFASVRASVPAAPNRSSKRADKLMAGAFLGFGSTATGGIYDISVKVRHLTKAECFL
jgi:hypothetical protein